MPQQPPFPDYVNWAQVKKRQAHEADHVGDIAGGIGEYRIANACYHLSEILIGQMNDELDAQKEIDKQHGN
jgi:hypothetical protein